MPREDFLQRVRESVAQGNRAGAHPELPARGRLGYQGAGAHAVTQFCEALIAAGGMPYVVRDEAAAAEKVIELCRERHARSLLLETGGITGPMQTLLKAGGFDVCDIATLFPETCREPFFSADIGVTGVRYLIAETGSLVMACGPHEPRSASLLPPVHIAVAHESQLLPDLFDLFVALKTQPALASCVTLITGPSKTGDIELKLVTGVHGPGEVHVVLISP